VFSNFRPLSDDEQKSNVPKVVSCNENKREVIVMQTVANKQVDRVFNFDKVCLFLLSFLRVSYYDYVQICK
jgi:hypothetical protein